MIEALLLIHVMAGVASILAAVWVFVEALNASDENQGRIRRMGIVSAVSMWVSFIVGGYWYVIYYPSDKATILKGPWPAAHEYFMETKEHLVIILLLLATYLPIVLANRLADNADARRLALWIAGLVPSLGLLI